jgi:hypothetical protein
MFKLSFDTRSAIADAKRAGGQMQFAVALALTWTAKDIQAAAIRDIGAKLDRPTDFTLKSTFVKVATKQDLKADVFVKNFARGKSKLGPAQMLGQQFDGNERAYKAVERLFYANGLIRSGEYLMPGTYASIDGYGNMSRSQISQIIKQLKAAGSITETKVTKTGTKRNKQKMLYQYFWNSAGGKALKGVYLRTPNGVRPVLLVTRKPSYKVKIDFVALGERVERVNFPVNMTAAWLKAQATAR